MTTIDTETHTLPAATLGPENPLPCFRAANDHLPLDFDQLRTPAEDRAGFGQHTGSRVLPYRMQDAYGRELTPRRFFSVVLENEFIKARVLPEAGGLVTSIYCKPEQRELIACNPVFQIGNLAIRNAWVYGGIEWNTAHLGHHCLTMEPLHTAVVDGIGGDPVLRMYAWERMKDFPFQIDLHLPAQSRFLFAHVQLLNPHDHAMPMYWWTNVGVPEYPGGRVLAPAETAFKHTELFDLPLYHDVDFSYGTRVNPSYDLYFRIPEEQRPWVAIVDAAGKGTVHASTRRLRGRKMFCWGMGRGGRRWQEHLAVPGFNVQEIQAGLCRTQLHTMPMPAKTRWDWTEAFGLIAADPRRAHSTVWKEAWTAVDEALGVALPQAEFDRLHAAAAAVAARPPREVLFRGLGWGALERRRARKLNLPEPVPPQPAFDDRDLGNQQDPWLRLLEEGVLPARDPHEEPGHFMIAPSWRELLEKSIATAQGDHWLSRLHLGVMKMEAGDPQGAATEWETSLRQTPNAWALRNLAQLDLRAGNPAAARERLKLAWDIGPKIAPLAIECANGLVAEKRWDDLEAFLRALPEALRQHERLAFQTARLDVERRRYAAAEAVFTRDFAGLREGELALSDLWYLMQEYRAGDRGETVDADFRQRLRREMAPPPAIDFRMFTEASDAYVPPTQATR